MEDTTRYFEADGHHAPIIDETTYYQVQEKINKVQRVSKTKRPTNEVYFCGVLYCNLCGAKYTTHWHYKKEADGRKTAAYPSYRCGNNAFKKCCTAKITAHSKVERAFEQYLSNYDDIQMLIEGKTNKPQYDNSAEIATMTAEVKQIEKKTEEIMSLFISNTIDFPTYQGMVRLSNERRGELEARLILLQNAQKEKAITYTAKDIITNFRENWSALNNIQRQQFVQKFFKKVTIHNEAPNGEYHGEVVIDEILFNEF
jgi:hypothetical protein